MKASFLRFAFQTGTFIIQVMWATQGHKPKQTAEAGNQRVERARDMQW